MANKKLSDSQVFLVGTGADMKSFLRPEKFPTLGSSLRYSYSSRLQSAQTPSGNLST